MKKQVKKRRRVFRVNVVITYFDKSVVEHFRPPLHEIMKNLAWLHSLEYAITEDQIFESSPGCGGEGLYKGTDDLIYLRSTEHTRIGAKDLRNIISCIVGRSVLSCYVVEMFCQSYKGLAENPFPKIFYRQLNYPYVEKHGIGESSLYQASDYVFGLLDSEADFLLN